MSQKYPISHNIRLLREKSNLSQVELAKLLDVSQQAISLWERGVSYPDVVMLYELCRIFGVTFDELMAFEIQPKPKLKFKLSNPKKRCCEFGGPKLDVLDNDDLRDVKLMIDFLAYKKEKGDS